MNADIGKIPFKERTSGRLRGIGLDAVICGGVGFAIFIGALFAETFERALTFGLIVSIAVAAVLAWSRIAKQEETLRDALENAGRAAGVLLGGLIVLYVLFHFVRSGGQ